MSKNRTSSPKPAGLVALEKRIRAHLAIDHYWSKETWVVPEEHEGVPIYDVIIVGGGQSGIATAFALMRQQVKRILVLDAQEPGREGPWRRHARMPILRSARDVPGPELGNPLLSFREWYDATCGEGSFEALTKIPREAWAEYIDWLRELLCIPVRNRCQVDGVFHDDGQFVLDCLEPAGACQYRARRVVFCTGLDGWGEPFIPQPLASLPPDRIAHTDEEIDFEALRGKRVTVVGAGAAAFDAAAHALKHGAQQVSLLCRRRALRKNGYFELWDGIRTPSAMPAAGADSQRLAGTRPADLLTPAMAHLHFMDDAERWDLARLLFENGRAPSTESHFALTEWPENFSITEGFQADSADVGVDGAVHLRSGDDTVTTDYVIAATGLTAGSSARRELRHLAGDILTWGERYQPEPGNDDEQLAAQPYLSSQFQFTPRHPDAGYVSGLYCFHDLLHMTAGIMGIPHIAPRIAEHICQDLYRASLARHRGYLAEVFDEQRRLNEQVARAHLLFLVGNGGPPVDYCLPRIARHGHVHALCLNKLNAEQEAYLRETCASISVLDQTRPIEEAIYEEARRVRAQAIVALDEFSLVAAATACERLGLRGPGPGARLARDKSLMRSAFAKAGVRSPRHAEISADTCLESVAREIPLPWMLKARNAAGSVGHAIVRNVDEARARLRESRALLNQVTCSDTLSYAHELKTVRFLVEEYMVGGDEWYDRPGFGTYVSVEGVVCEGRYTPLAVTSKFPLIPPATEVGGLTPCALSPDKQAQIARFAGEMVAALGLSTCGTHTEVKLLPNGELAAIETAARFAGRATLGNVEHVHGIDMVDHLVRALLYGDPGVEPGGLVHAASGAAAELSLLPVEPDGVPWEHPPTFYRSLPWDELVAASTEIRYDVTVTRADGEPIEPYKPVRGALNDFALISLRGEDPETVLGDIERIRANLRDVLERLEAGDEEEAA